MQCVCISVEFMMFWRQLQYLRAFLTKLSNVLLILRYSFFEKNTKIF